MADPTPPQATPQPADTQEFAQLSIEKIYVKDLSIENPGAPQSFRLAEQPQIEIGLRTASTPIEGTLWETVLTMTVTARSADRTVFLVEAAQAGVFNVQGPEAQVGMLLAVHTPQILFPYARETIADATQRMGFPPIHLAPINFEALYAQQQGQQAAGQPAVANA